MTTAFQVGAFQFTGFQEAGVGSGGWAPWLLLDYQQRLRIRRRRKEREEKEKREQEAAIAALKPPLVAIRYVARPQDPIVERTVLARLQARQRLDVEAELADFRELMQMIADVDEFA